MDNTKAYCMDIPAFRYSDKVDYMGRGRIGDTSMVCSVDTTSVDKVSTSGKTYTSDADYSEEYNTDRSVDNNRVETGVEYTKSYIADKPTSVDNTMMYKKVFNAKEFGPDRLVANGAICTINASTNNMSKSLTASPVRFPKQCTGYKPRTALGAVSNDYSRSDFFTFVERMNRSKLHGVAATTSEEATPLDSTVKKSSFNPVPRFSVIPKNRDVDKYVLDQARIFDHRQRVDEYVTTSNDLLATTPRVPEQATAPITSFIKSSSVISCKPPQSTQYYPYAQLRTPGPFPAGIDVRYRELYLNDAEFESVFGTLKKNWSCIPLWKQISMKKAAGLF